MTTELTRIRLDVAPVTEINFRDVPKWMWESASTRFLDSAMGSGQFLYEIKKKLLSYGHSEDNIASRLFGYATDFFALQYGINRFELRGKFVIGDFLEAKLTRKFDMIISNPPYDGKAQLHQRFFNEAMNWVNNGGVVCFIQPATPYYSKRDTRSHETTMKANISKYTTNVTFVSPSIFEGATIGNDLAITTLVKTPSKWGLKRVTYKNGVEYQNIPLFGVNMLEMDPALYMGIREKYEQFIKNNGSINDVLHNKRNVFVKNVAKIQKVRGHMECDDFYTFMSDDPQYWSVSVNDIADFGISVTCENEMTNVYTYLKTFVARFGLALSKLSTNNHGGELKTVPLVPFDRNWTDEELAELIGLTDEELDIIRTVLSDYHGLLK